MAWAGAPRARCCFSWRPSGPRTMSAGWPRRGRAATLRGGTQEGGRPGCGDTGPGGWARPGVADFSLARHRRGGQPADLAFAVTLVDDLLERAISDRSGTWWSNHEFRLPEP